MACGRMSDALDVVTRKGFTGDQLRACLDRYKAINVLTVNPSNTKIMLTG